jgi:uncharacterized membrane protein (DUF485 family)
MEDEDIKADGRQFKAERKQFRNTILTFLSFLTAFSLAFFVMSFFLSPLKEHLTASLTVLSLLASFSLASVFVVLARFKKVLSLSDYEAGREKLRREEKKQEEIKRRNGRDE